jgi:hypothetical protein
MAVILEISFQRNVTPCCLVISTDSRKEFSALVIMVDGPLELPHGGYKKWCSLH